MSDYDNALKAAFSDGKAQPTEYDTAFNGIFDTASPMQAKKKPEAVKDFGGNLRFATPFGTIDTRLPLPESVNKMLASVGSGMADYGMATAAPAAVDEKRAIDAALNTDTTGKVLHFAGKVLPSLAIPAAGGVTGAALAGGALGAMEPVGTGDSRLFNTASGALLSAAIPGAISGFKSMVRPDAARTELAKSAMAEGIPVGAADISNSRFLKAAKSVLNDTPFIGGIGEAQNAAKQAAFNRAVGSKIGIGADSLTPDIVQAAGKNIGNKLDAIWSQNPMEYTANLFGTLRQAETLAANMPKADAHRITNWIAELESKAVQMPDGKLMIPGDVANRFQSNLRQLASSAEGMSKNDLSQLRQGFLAEFNQQAGPKTGGELGKALSDYRAWKTVIKPLMDSAEAGVAGRVAGDVPAALLSQKIASEYGSASLSPFGNLPQIGSQFLVNRTPQTGGSIRAAIQNSLIGSTLLGGGGIGGAVLGGAAGGLGGAAIGLGSGALLQKLLGSPAVAKSVLQDSVKRGLLDAPEAKKMLIDLAKTSASRLPMAAGMGLLSAPAFE